MSTEPVAPASANAASCIETHTAVVFFVGDRVYKLKKPLDLGFLDHTTREARERSCRQEVELNSRLAPDVYLGVFDVSGPDGALLDHLVAMRRMPDDRRLSRCVERGEDVEGALRTIAHSIATLHAGSGRNDDRDGEATPAAVRARWTDGFDQLRAFTPMLDRPERLAETEALALRYIDGRGPLFLARIEQGHIRDGHGDLQAEDIFVLPDGPRVLDCIEFGDAYRWGDVLSDVAFLAMDLERLGRADLARTFLAMHRELTADRWPNSLAHHYIAYRAHVRAKVGMLRHAQRGEPITTSVDRLVDLCLEHLRAAQPHLVIVGGLPGTGKSTLAAGIGDRIGAVVLRTDEVRRRMGDGETESDRYSADSVAAVYRETLAEAQRLLGLGESVVLDATWRSDHNRRAARAVARDTHTTLHEVRCVLDADAAAQRIRRRLRAGEDPSEATPAVARSMAREFDPWPEAGEVDTAGAPEVVVAQVLSQQPFAAALPPS